MANAGEFAALWNACSPTQRETVVRNIRLNQEAAGKCFEQDHDGLKVRLEQLLKISRLRRESMDEEFLGTCSSCSAPMEIQTVRRQDLEVFCPNEACTQYLKSLWIDR